MLVGFVAALVFVMNKTYPIISVHHTGLMLTINWTLMQTPSSLFAIVCSIIKVQRHELGFRCLIVTGNVTAAAPLMLTRGQLCCFHPAGPN